MEAWRTKNGGWRKVEDEVCDSLHDPDLISWSHHPYHSYLQNCHYEL